MDKIEKLAALHKPESDVDDLVALARVVRSIQGAKRFRTAVGAPIVTRPKELKKLEKGTKIDPETGRVKTPGKSGAANHKLFAMKVAELQEKLEKLDADAIRNLLKQLDQAKDVPKSANYQKIREMLKRYLKEKAGKDDEKRDKLTGK